MRETDPHKIKQISSRIKNYWKDKWQSAAKEIAIKANSAKFLWNKTLLEILKETGDMTIAESSRGQFWGIEIYFRDTGCLDPSYWYNSSGLMEEVLVAVKAKLFPKPKITLT